MNDDSFELKGNQKRAVEVRDRDVVVTAGAGSGKTLTLVERYLALLEEGHTPRQILAITFTEKAAREMRNRIRASVRARAERAPHPEEQEFWLDLEAGMDAARISTIHSFCAEILRSHPAEAGVDPEFEVVEEGMVAVLRRQAVEDTLAWATDQPEVALIFSSFSPRDLERLLAFLLERRLDVESTLQDGEREGWRTVLGAALWAFVEEPEVSSSVLELHRMQSDGELLGDAGDKLADQLIGLLNRWDSLAAALQSDRLVPVAARLFEIRREYMDLRAGKRDSRAKELLRGIRDIYDERVDPWLGGANSSDSPPEEAAEAGFIQDFARLKSLFGQGMRVYRGALEERHGLDFDDLEAKAQLLLIDPAIRERWQAEFTNVLVDEFQDTNDRQRQIIEALCGEVNGRQFVVGDARQSIYRFRGADVTVFRKMGAAIQARGGESVELDVTYRAHEGLLQVLDQLLPSIMGEREDPDRLYEVPYTKMTAHRREQREGVLEPFVELIFGVGENAEMARPRAARALVQRLLELRDGGQILSWEDVALLFRASTGFGAYEDALEAFGVPFVTVAGRGFYDRPEIRDVLNILRALADPWDDLALAGLLRSPIFGLTDAALYKLRWDGSAARPLRIGLMGELDELEEGDRHCALRAREILEEFSPLVDRLPVVELLKRVVDRTDYRAALASAHRRYWQNLDKLLADAHASGLVRVRAFLEYIRSVRDVGVREGEAPVEVEGAVRLMTVHKAKGLEFPIVVIADASRRMRTRAEAAYLLDETGLAFKPDRLDSTPLVYRLARWVDRQQSEAEENRLLYVAATRAREKLVVNGHCRGGARGWRTDGWMEALREAAGMDLDTLAGAPGDWHQRELTGGALVGAYVAPIDGEGITREGTRVEVKWPSSAEKPLYHSLVSGAEEEGDAELDEEPARDWRATGARVSPPASVVGLMVHQALEGWLFPGDKGLEMLLETVALREGLVDSRQRRGAIREARGLLARLKAHPLWAEIDGADERHHEVPYTHPLPNGRLESGIIDLLYKAGGGWALIDFKIDELRDGEMLMEAIEQYRTQIRRYSQAARSLLQASIQAELCFLDYMGKIWVEPM